MRTYESIRRKIMGSDWNVSGSDMYSYLATLPLSAEEHNSLYDLFRPRQGKPQMTKHSFKKWVEKGRIRKPKKNTVEQSKPAKMKIYIAGKITGIPFSEAKHNFGIAKGLIESWGFEAISPLDYGDESKSWVENMLILLPILNTCDGIYLLDNWDDSDGARIGKKFAEKKGMFVINNL